MEHILFGIVGFILGSGLLYGLQQRQLDNTQLRLERAQKALQQAEKLNKQQAAQLHKFQQAKAQNDKLKEYYQAKFQGLEQSYRIRLQELEQYLKSSPEIPTAEETRQETQVYEQERDNNGPASYLINPFTSKESEKQEESQTPDSEFDLAELLESEGNWKHGAESQPELPKSYQEHSTKSDLDFLETLSSAPDQVAELPEIFNNDSDSEHTLIELFADQETSSNDIQEFLDMLESEAGSEAETNEHKSDNHSEITD